MAFRSLMHALVGTIQKKYWPNLRLLSRNVERYFHHKQTESMGIRSGRQCNNEKNIFVRHCFDISWIPQLLPVIIILLRSLAYIVDRSTYLIKVNQSLICIYLPSVDAIIHSTNRTSEALEDLLRRQRSDEPGLIRNIIDGRYLI